MNIGIFTDTYFPQISGVAASIATLDKELTALGHNVYIFTSTDEAANKANEVGKVFRLPSFKSMFVPERRLAYSGVRTASQLVRKLQIDVVHTHTEFSMGCLGKYLAKKYKLPFIHTYHTMYEDYVHYVARGKLLTPYMVGKLTKWFCRGADLVIAPTEKVKKTLKRYGVVAQISVVPTGISLKQFKRTNQTTQKTNALREKLGFTVNDRIIVSIGRMAEEKNMQALVHAVKQGQAIKKPFQLVLVGDGPERKKLETLTHSLGVTDFVHFVGAVDWKQIQYYYQLSNVFVSASTTEAQGLTYIEAMASGCAVVAKADPSIESIVQHEETGFVFQKDEDLADVLQSIWANPDLLARIQENGNRHVKPLSAETFGRKLERVYFVQLRNQQYSERYVRKQSSLFYRMRRSS
ncbi:glycosyltransferase LafA [Bacillus sp. JCM 19046]|nr:glycosyltransferase LafA [Bacillus sp. JCM 19045]GAF19953.1 glycosyltransferase LafA [Bacillus sp. JCM 19046]